VAATLALIPNALTVLRLLLIPVFVTILLQADGDASWPAGLVFAACGLTDQLDGWLARRWEVESTFGKFADPLADRLTIDAAVVVLFLVDRLPWPALAVILARDALLVGGYRLVMPRGYEFSVSLLGKVATWVLYAATALVMVPSESTEWPLSLFWAGLALAILAAGFYVAGAARTVRR